MRILVTVCTYNERDNIERLIAEIRRVLPNAAVLVVDDNSPDGTADIVRTLGETDPQVQLLLRQQKEGLGAATLAGFQEAVATGYELVINMDADFSHPPGDLPALVQAIQQQEADVAIGSRYISGGAIEGWSWLRHFMSQGVNLYSHYWLGLRIGDCSGAFRAYRSSLLAKILHGKIRAKGYAFQEEFLFRCVQAGARVVEVPIVFEDRIKGQSKINFREVRRALWDIFLVGLEPRNKSAR